MGGPEPGRAARRRPVLGSREPGEYPCASPRVVARAFGHIGAQHVRLELIGLGIGVGPARRAQHGGGADRVGRGVGVLRVLIGPAGGHGDGGQRAQRQRPQRLLLRPFLDMAGDVMPGLVAQTKAISSSFRARATKGAVITSSGRPSSSSKVW